MKLSRRQWLAATAGIVGVTASPLGAGRNTRSQDISKAQNPDSPWPARQTDTTAPSVRESHAWDLVV